MSSSSVKKNHHRRRGAAGDGGATTKLESLVDSLLKESSVEVPPAAASSWWWSYYERLWSLMSQIRDCEKKSMDDTPTAGAATPTTPTRVESIPLFLSWLGSNGVVGLENVEVVEVDGGVGLGVVVRRGVQRGETVFRVPRKVILTSQFVREESRLGRLCGMDPLVGGMENIQLALYLVYLRWGLLPRHHSGSSGAAVAAAGDSFWSPYVSVLPGEYPSSVLFFTKEQMAVLLKHDEAFIESVRMLRNVSRQYAYLHIKFRKSEDDADCRLLRGVFTLNRYLWGVSGVSTRINHIPSSKSPPPPKSAAASAPTTLSLIPLWDLLNHEDSGILCTDYDASAVDALVCLSPREYVAGEEFRIFYGRRSSVDFFVHNGFVPQDNNIAAEHFNLQLGTSRISGGDHKVLERKQKLLPAAASGGVVVFNLRVEEDIPPSLLRFVQVFLAKTQEELDGLESSPSVEVNKSDYPRECWLYLSQRLGLLLAASEGKSAKVGRETLLTTATAMGENNNDDALVLVGRLVLQLLKNEQKVLRVLKHKCDAKLSSSSGGSKKEEGE